MMNRQTRTVLLYKRCSGSERETGRESQHYGSLVMVARCRGVVAQVRIRFGGVLVREVRRLGDT